jgi:hypothetical protein
MNMTANIEERWPDRTHRQWSGGYVSMCQEQLVRDGSGNFHIELTGSPGGPATRRIDGTQAAVWLLTHGHHADPIIDAELASEAAALEV